MVPFSFRRLASVLVISLSFCALQGEKPSVPTVKNGPMQPYSAAVALQKATAVAMFPLIAASNWAVFENRKNPNTISVTSLELLADFARIANAVLSLYNHKRCQVSQNDTENPGNPKNRYYQSGLLYKVAWLGIDCTNFIYHLYDLFAQLDDEVVPVPVADTQTVTPEENKKPIFIGINIESEQDLEDMDEEELDKHLNMLVYSLRVAVLPFVESMAALYVACNADDTSSLGLKYDACALSLGSLARLTSDYLASKKGTMQEKLYLAAVLSHVVVTVYEFAKEAPGLITFEAEPVVPPVVQAQVVKQPVQQQPVQQPTNQPVVSQQVVQAPVVNPPAVNQQVVQAPVINPPVINPPVVNPPVVNPPVINPPVVNPPVVNPVVPVVNPIGTTLLSTKLTTDNTIGTRSVPQESDKKQEATVQKEPEKKNDIKVTLTPDPKDGEKIKVGFSDYVQQLNIKGQQPVVPNPSPNSENQKPKQLNLYPKDEAKNNVNTTVSRDFSASENDQSPTSLGGDEQEPVMTPVVNQVDVIEKNVSPVENSPSSMIEDGSNIGGDAGMLEHNEEQLQPESNQQPEVQQDQQPDEKRVVNYDQFIAEIKAGNRTNGQYWKLVEASIGNAINENGELDLDALEPELEKIKQSPWFIKAENSAKVPAYVRIVNNALQKCEN